MLAQPVAPQSVVHSSASFEFRPHGCPCGFLTDPKNECHCTARQISSYMSRISGPLLDRIDIHIEMPPVDARLLRKLGAGRSSADIRADVAAARDRQTERFAGTDIRANARMSHKAVLKHCPLDDACEALLATAMSQIALSARAHDKILKVARTIADLEGHPAIHPDDLAEAINYRSLDRQLWA